MARNEFCSRPGLPRPGLSRPGLSRPGLSRPGLSRPGLSRPGLSRGILPIGTLVLALGCAQPAARETSPADEGGTPASVAAPEAEQVVRIACFNVKELGRDKLDQLEDGVGAHPQLRSAAEIIQRLRPDVLLLNEIDFDDERQAVELFHERYLAVSQNGQEPISYAHRFFEATNTGVPSGHDFDNDGKTDGPADAYGFGRYPGQYGMALLSHLPIDAASARTFRELRWRDMPGNLMPDGSDGKPDWYNAEETEIFRLSSKSHWDVPVEIGERTVHILASHPTPPVFDGDEDANGRRNFDEIRLWADYLTGGDAASYLVDDRGQAGALAADASFVVMGDLNADPFNAENPYGRTAISQLLEHPRIRDPHPRHAGGPVVDRPYAGPTEERTAAYGRLDYVLPSRDLEVRDAGVFWPPPDDPLHHLVAGEAEASDHALVWIDVAFSGE
ncbi:MAG: endonuclease/exonuclease/phosphatase family protein [Acidobacteriota bacterium]